MEKKKRILCVDYGDVRTGLAVSDVLGLLASGICTVKAGGDRTLIEKIRPYVEQYDISLIVVGNPINMDGSHGPRSEKACAFGQKLSEALGIEVVMFDERCTTMEAHRFMNETDTRGKKRKSVVDTLSAQIILQDYMDSNK